MVWKRKKEGTATRKAWQLESHQKPGRTDAGHPFVMACLEAAREAYGAEPIIHPSSAASGPTSPFNEFLGVPCVAMGIGNLGGRIHAPNENSVRGHFEQGVAFGVASLERLDRGL